MIESWYLEGAAAGGNNLLYPLERLPFRVGRDATCELSVASRDISRVHAQIEADGHGGLRVVGCFFAEIWRDMAHFDAEQFALGHDILARHDPLRGDTLYVSSMTIDPILRGGGVGVRARADDGVRPTG